MITLFTGAPGAGKTAALVDLLSKLEGDRPIFVDGLNGLKLPHMPCDATKWPEELPDGAILVIDEVQRMWRPRGPGSKVPPEVQALETHRHRGIDIYVTTQAPRLLDANVRALVGRHVHIRDTGWLGRHWYEWPEVNDAMAWKTCQNKRSYKLPKHAFDLYKSSSLHTKPVRKTPAIKYLAVLAVVGALIGAAVVVRIMSKGVTDAPTAASVAPKLIGGPAGAAAHGGAPASLPAPFLDDRVVFMPRISDKPETAPAYDPMRVVVNMPRIAGVVCFKGECRCMSQQGTVLDIQHKVCAAWLERPAFDPYTMPPPPPRVTASVSEKDAADTEGGERQTAKPRAKIEASTLLDGVNPGAEAKPPPTVPRSGQWPQKQATDAQQRMPALSLQNPYRRS